MTLPTPLTTPSSSRFGVEAAARAPGSYESHWSRAALIITCCAFASAICWATEARAQTVRDSAGVRVVVSALRLDAAYTTGASPAIRVGSENKSPLSRVNDARFLNDSVAAIVHGTQVILFNYISGELLREVGRPGNGPLEFNFAWRVVPGKGDSVAVFDSNGYYEIFPLAGIGSRRLRVERLRQPIGHIGTDTVVVSLPPSWRGSGKNASQIQPFQLMSLRTGALLNRPMLEFSVGDYVPFDNHRTLKPLGLVRSIAARAGKVYSTDGRAIGYDVYDQLGRLISQVRADVAPTRVTAAHRREFERRLLGDDPQIGLRYPEARARMSLGYPDFLPSVSALVVARDGKEIWLREYLIQQLDSPDRWYVFSAPGELLGTVVMPPRTVVADVTAGNVMAIHIDENDVETVLIYRLTAAR